MSYVTLVNESLNCGTERLTVELDKPGKLVHFHLRHARKSCAEPGCPHVDCGDMHFAMSWDQVREMTAVLGEVVMHCSAHHFVALQEVYACQDAMDVNPQLCG